MRRALTCGAILSLLAVIVVFGNCGDVDPAKAPYYSMVTTEPTDVGYEVTCIAGQTVELRDEFLVRALVVGEYAASPYIQPLNNVEVRWTTRFPGNIGIYLPEDNVDDVDPLETPYVGKTDDRGISEVKILVNVVTVCSGTAIGYIEADTGVASSQVSLTYTTTDIGTEDDDDDE
ncbi:MAG: hypothetical protein P9M14_09805 [Candidatus Alcyoniella australis]|nr:hypothetical protein [Candidatus Alcyoniella australis]